jgi:putative heme-binding domain-containing protein
MKRSRLQPGSMSVVSAMTLVVCTLALPASGQQPAVNQPEEAVFVSPIDTMTEADLAAGRSHFRIHCARCHGMLGEGGEGPSLKRPRLQHAPDDEALFEVIDDGIRGTGMPGTFGPNDEALWQIAGYVRSLGRLPAEEMPGDPALGQQIYEGKGGCPACHITAGVGHGVGPELTDVGARRNLEYLRRSLTNPDADHPMISDWRTGNINAFLTVRVVSEAGEYEGLRINEDEYSVQMRDLSGAIHSFDKSELIDLERAFGHSLMPGYDTVLSGTEIDNLASYLMSLKGAASVDRQGDAP